MRPWEWSHNAADQREDEEHARTHCARGHTLIMAEFLHTAAWLVRKQTMWWAGNSLPRLSFFFAPAGAVRAVRLLFGNNRSPFPKRSPIFLFLESQSDFE